jgi:uncharacterized membrane protein YedE/YeeE
LNPRLAIALPLLLGGAVWLARDFGARQAALWLIGAALGVALLHARFGFTAAYRRLLLERRGVGVRAQLLLIGLCVLAFQPMLAADAGMRGFVFPVGMALLLGAFLFGLGMQLGGGCGSGTLYAVGGGVPRMGLTLLAFVAGATLAAWQSELWSGWPALAPVNLPWALPGSLTVVAIAWWASVAWEKSQHINVQSIPWRGGHAWRGPWPLGWGAVALAGLSVLTLWVAGRPWAITAAFPLWGSHAVATLGWDDPSFWPFWEDPTRVEAWLRPLMADRITVMDLGLILGAMAASGLAGPATWRWPRGGEVLASILGGLLLGLGAVLATGCNISAFLGGVASGSLHGWIWIIPALFGNWLGAWLRPVFRLD